MTNETKRTPGKWVVKRHTEDYGYGYGQTNIFVEIEGDELIRIGTHDCPNNAYYEDVARLIACAPELLEALESFCGTATSDWMEKRNRLIARAKGGTDS